MTGVAGGPVQRHRRFELLAGGLAEREPVRHDVHADGDRECAPTQRHVELHAPGPVAVGPTFAGSNREAQMALQVELVARAVTVSSPRRARSIQPLLRYGCRSSVEMCVSRPLRLARHLLRHMISKQLANRFIPRQAPLVFWSSPGIPRVPSVRTTSGFELTHLSFPVPTVTVRSACG